MIFAIGDDVTLTVYDDLAHVRRACRAVDVKHGFYRFFDDRGRPLTPVFVPPPVARRNLFRAAPAQNRAEEFELVPAREDARPHLRECLAHDIVLNTRPHFSSAEQIRAYIDERSSARPAAI